MRRSGRDIYHRSTARDSVYSHALARGCTMVLKLHDNKLHFGTSGPDKSVTSSGLDEVDVRIPKMAHRETQFDGPRIEKAEFKPNCQLDSQRKSELQSVPSADKVDGQTDVDGWLFRKAKSTKAQDTQDAIRPNKVYQVIESVDVPAGPARNAEEYDMNHKRRGVALIFNHIHFKNMTTRNGSIKDCADLKGVLSKLGFEVRVYVDPEIRTISTILQSTAAEDHTDADCLVVAAMSHGESGLLHSSDTLYPVDMLWTPFTGDRCSSLIGKPKLFFIQACRGARLDKGVKIIHETDSKATTYSIPAFADIMVAYSTYDGFYSWRNPDAGSWFIQAICEEFNLNGRSRDLLTLMTFVNRRVAIEYQSYVPNNESFDAKKQIPSVVSMLTRLVHFQPRSSSDLIPSGIDRARLNRSERGSVQSEK